MERKVFSLLNKLKQDKKTVLIAAAGILGMLLLALSGSGVRHETASEPFDCEAMRTQLTRQTEALLETVDGVGKVRVILTVDGFCRNEYARDTEESEEDDSVRKSSDYVLTGKDEAGLLLYTSLPQVRGIAVSCEGGSSGVVRQEVTKLLAAAFGIPVNRIWVTKMKNH